MTDTDTIYVAEYSEGIDTMARYAATSHQAAYDLIVEECRDIPPGGIEALEHRGGSYDAENVWVYPHDAWPEDVIYEPGIIIRELPIHD